MKLRKLTKVEAGTLSLATLPNNKKAMIDTDNRLVAYDLIDQDGDGKASSLLDNWKWVTKNYRSSLTTTDK